MGCDIWPGNESKPYCAPKCVQFKLVVRLDRVVAQCVICNLNHEFTVHGGQIMVQQEERKSK